MPNPVLQGWVQKQHRAWRAKPTILIRSVRVSSCYNINRSSISNCHLQDLIQRNYAAISFHVCPLEDNVLIAHAERALIQTLRPAWNTALTR